MAVQRVLDKIKAIRKQVTTELGKAIDAFAGLCEEVAELKDFENDAITFQGSFSTYSKKVMKNLLSDEARTLEENKIRNGFLELLTVAGKTAPEQQGTEPINLTPEHPQFTPPQIVAIEETTKAIFEQLQQSPVPVVIHGIGGSGKSTLAQNIYKQFKATFDYFGWIPARESFELAFMQHDRLLKALGISPLEEGEKAADKFREIEDTLKGLPGLKLLVLDGADWEFGRNGFLFLDSLQKEYGYKLLVTSRIHHSRFKTVNIPRLSETQATEIFYLYYGKPAPETPDADIGALLQFIGYHSLLIELCAKTLRDSWELTAVDILDKFKGNNLRNIEETVSREMDYRQDTITGLLEAVFDMAGLAEDERLLLMQLSVLCSQPVSFDDLCFVFDQEENKAGFKKRLDVLIQKGWIDREGKSVMVHPAVAVAVKSTIKPDEENCKVLAVDFIERLFQLERDRPETKFSQTRYLSLLENIAVSITGEAEAMAGVYHKLASVHRDLGRLDEALKYQQQAVGMGEKVLSDDHPSLASSYNNLSLIYKNLGNLPEALKYQQQAISIKEKVLSDDHPSLATSYNNLSLIHKNLGNLPEALKYQQQAIGIKEKVFSSDHPSLATSYSNLSLIYKNLGNLPEALEYQQQAVVINEKALNGDHPSLATSYSNLSLIYFEQDRKQEAIVYMQKAVDIIKACFPNGHPRLTASLKSLAHFRESLNQ